MDLKPKLVVYSGYVLGVLVGALNGKLVGATCITWALKKKILRPWVQNSKIAANEMTSMI